MVESKTIRNILHARKHNGLFSAIVLGERGIGKSSYAIQTLFHVFRYLGFDIETSWQMALDRTLYTIPEIINFLEKSSKEKYKDAFVFDDAGVYAGGVRWQTHYREMVLLESLCDTMRNSVYGVLLTVPDIRTLSRRLRSYDDFVIKIYLPTKQDRTRLKLPFNDINTRIARTYKKAMSPKGQSSIYRRHNDSFDIMLPDWVYHEYQKKRKKYGQEDLRQLKQLIEK